MLRILSAVLFGIVLTTSTFAQEGYRLKSIRPQFVFAPSGFDSNDNVQIVLYGIFTNVCHRVAEPRVTVDRESHQVLIQHRAYIREMCTEMYVNIPYTTVINLGALPEGKYEIKVGDGSGYKRVQSFTVQTTLAPGSVDDHFYAQIYQVEYRDQGLSFPEVTLRGAITNTCLSLKEIKVSYSEGHVVDIRPILNVRNYDCKTTKVLFSKTVQLRIPRGTPSLLNVRTAGGQATLQVADPRDTLFRTINTLKP